MNRSLVLAALLAGPAAADDRPIDFNRDVRPILSNTCYACHGPDEKVRKAKLRLDSREGAIESAVVPGKPDASELVKRVASPSARFLRPRLYAAATCRLACALPLARATCSLR